LRGFFRGSGGTPDQELVARTAFTSGIAEKQNQQHASIARLAESSQDVGLGRNRVERPLAVGLTSRRRRPAFTPCQEDAGCREQVRAADPPRQRSDQARQGKDGRGCVQDAFPKPTPRFGVGAGSVQLRHGQIWACRRRRVGGAERSNHRPSAGRGCGSPDPRGAEPGASGSVSQGRPAGARPRFAGDRPPPCPPSGWRQSCRPRHAERVFPDVSGDAAGSRANRGGTTQADRGDRAAPARSRGESERDGLAASWRMLEPGITPFVVGYRQIGPTLPVRRRAGRVPASRFVRAARVRVSPAPRPRPPARS